MTSPISRRVFATGATAALCAPFIIGTAKAQEKVMRISVDVNGTHHRTKFMQHFAGLVNARGKGALKAEVMHSGQLYKDRDVPKALRQGSLEMGCPATWFMSSLEPNLDIFDSSIVYGLSDDKLYTVLNGPAGASINNSIEQKFQVKILGEWFGHAPSHIFSVSRPIAKVEDLANLKIRIPGGAGSASIVRTFKASPVQAPWPDVPMALNSGTFDAVVTACDGVASAKLWDAGIKHAYLDHMQFSFYVPMIANSFWNTLPRDLQDMVLATWAEIRPEGRANSRKSDEAAQAELVSHGINMVRPSAADLAAQRAMLIAAIDLSKETRINPAFLKQMSDALI